MPRDRAYDKTKAFHRTAHCPCGEGWTARMNYANIKYNDIANGPGVRTTLFVSGCRVGCPGCFNSEARDFEFGAPFDDDVANAVLKSLEPSWTSGVTVLGGEPFEPENQRDLLSFLRRVRERFCEKSVWCFTGYVFDRDIVPLEGRRHTQWTDELLSLIDVLVDGPFVAAKHDVSLRFKGSSNQRLIDVAASLARGEVVEWADQDVYSTHSM